MFCFKDKDKISKKHKIFTIVQRQFFNVNLQNLHFGYAFLFKLKSSRGVGRNFKYENFWFYLKRARKAEENEFEKHF